MSSAVSSAVSRAVSGLVVGVVVAAVGLTAAPTASAAVTTPTIVSQSFDPAAVVFASTSAIPVSGTVVIEQPAGWTFEGAFVPDPSCTPDGQRPTQDCPALLTSTSVTTTPDTLLVTLSGDVPDTLADGTLNRLAPGPRVYLDYTDDTGAAQLVAGAPAFSAYGALRSRLSGPASVAAGGAVTFTAYDERFSTAWEPLAGSAALEFRSDATGTWATVAAQVADGSGTVAFYRPSVSQSGTWRVRLAGPPATYSNEVHVTVVATPVVPTPPPAPQPPSAPPAAVSARTYSSLTVNWSAPAQPNGAILAYRWGWTSATGQPARSWSREYQVRTPALRRPFVIGGLAPRTRYSIWVQAVNAQGAGARRTVVATTLADPAHRPSAPRRTKVRAGKQRVTLRWALPATTGGAAITSYQVRLGKGQVREVARTTRRVVFTGLRAGQRYRLAVRAHNRVGYGPWARKAVRLPAVRHRHPDPAPTSQPHSSCTSGYSPCIAPGPDVDCAGGSGNGPRYVHGPVRVHGSDPYGLDSDHDGVACES